MAEDNALRRSARGARARRIGIMALFAIVGCTGDESAARRLAPTSTSVTGAATSSTTPTPCDVDDGTGAQLEPQVTDDVPAGYEPAPDEAEDTGRTDLDMAASFVGDPAEQGVLSVLQFRRGYQRLFYGPDGSGDLIVHVYEFCDAQGAAGYLPHTRERLLSPLWGSVEVDVVGVPEPGVALLQEAEPEDDSFVAILRVEGPFYVEIGAYGRLAHEGLDTLTAKAQSLSDAQLADLT